MSAIDIKTLSKEEKAAVVCLYYAQLKKSDTEYKKCFTDLKIVAEKYGLKKNTLKNDKQAYDALFDNGRNGWHDRPIEKRKRLLHDIYIRFKDIDLDNLRNIVSDIVDEACQENLRFFSIKTKDSETVKEILEKNTNIEFDGINILQDSLKIGQLVFIVLGGDRPAWDTGLVGIGIISEEPYDIGYSGKNFKIKVDIKLIMEKTIKREDLVPYSDTYGIIGIGPITKWEPNQAISQINEKNAIALMRAMLDLCPSIEEELKNLVDEDIMARIKGATTMFVPVEVNYKEKLSNGIKELTKEDLDDPDEEEPEAEEYTKKDFLNDVFISEKEYDILSTLLKRKKNIILQGAPGVGKTYAAKRLAYSILGQKSKKNIKVLQFHQSYSYEDFIAGFRPTENGFSLESGPFYDFCKDAENDSVPYFFIIDEINRGNLSKIFGELLMLIEADKRSEKVSLLYLNEEFGIPENVYIIGMMNTADRGLAVIDYALRRRFAFYEMKPAFDTERFKAKLSGSCSETENLISVIKNLNTAITEDDSLGPGFQIGHSYFCSDEPLSKLDLEAIVEYEIIPLINEYWFDEPSKIEDWTEKLRGAL